MKSPTSDQYQYLPEKSKVKMSHYRKYDVIGWLMSK